MRHVPSHRTLIPIQYPPHVVALGSLYVGALLSSFEQPMAPERSGYNSSHQIAAILSKRGEWELKFHAQVEDLEGMYSFHQYPHLLRVDSQYVSDSTCSDRPSHPIRSKFFSQHIASHTVFPVSTPISAQFTYILCLASCTTTGRPLQGRPTYPAKNCNARI